MCFSWRNKRRRSDGRLALKEHRRLHSVVRVLNHTAGAVPFKDYLRQIESQAASAHAAAAGALLPVESLKKMSQSLLADMGPRVFDAERRRFSKAAAPDADSGPFRGVEGGVGEQVPHGLF